MNQQERDAALDALAKLCFEKQRTHDSIWQNLSQRERDTARNTVIDALRDSYHEYGYINAHIVAQDVLKQPNASGEAFEICFDAFQAMLDIIEQENR